MSKETSFLANPEVSVHKEKGGRAILYNADTGALTLINATGWIIWKHLQDDPRTKAEIVRHPALTRENFPQNHVKMAIC